MGILSPYLPWLYLYWKLSFSLIILVPTFYITSEILVNRFFENGQYFSFVVLALLLITEVILFRYGSEDLILREYMFKGNQDLIEVTERYAAIAEHKWLRYLISTISTFLLAVLYRLLYSRIDKQSKENQL